MSNSVNVINKAEKDLDIMVNSIDGNIQIIIDIKKEEVDLLSLEPGEVFKVNNVEYIVLEQLIGNRTAVIKKELLEDGMNFGPDNNWKMSNLREKLNNEYLKELEKDFGKDRIIEHSVDLLSLDGLDDYGTSTDKVSLLTVDQYRKYRKVLGKNLDTWWWLATPDSTPSGEGASCVQCVHSDGYVSCNDCVFGEGVRPFFIVQS